MPDTSIEGKNLEQALGRLGDAGGRGVDVDRLY
jgi:hypothetical protein